MNENINNQLHQASKANQANNQEFNQQAFDNSEAKTIVNGKIVSISQAQQMMEAAEAQVNQTGVTEQHSNHSEPVQAGQVAKSNANAQMEQTQNLNVKQANLQSGQTHMQQHMNQAQVNATNAAQNLGTQGTQSTQASQAATQKARARGAQGQAEQ